MNRERSADLVILVTLWVALAVLHGEAIGQWWLNDDPQVLLQAIRNSPLETLSDPGSWQTLSASNFTPLVTLSFELDLALGGPEPRLFYVHHLLAAGFALTLLFILLRRAVPPLSAGLACAGVLLSPAMFYATRTLMVRHYLEGLCLALLALLVWDWRRESRIAGVGVACLYLGSMLAKEVYAPLPLVMMVMARARGERWRDLLLRILPSVVAAAVYLFWRIGMLGSGGGYGSAKMRPLETLQLLWLQIAGPVPRPVALVWIIVAGVIVGMALPRKGRLFAGAITAGAVAVVLPLVPLGSLLDVRHALVPTIALFALLALALGAIERERGIATGALALFLFAAGYGGFRTAAALDRYTTRMSTEGRYVWSHPAGAPVLLAGAPEWYLSGIADLRRVEGKGDAPPYVLSGHALLLGVADVDATVAATDSGDLAPIPAAVSAQIRARRAAADPDAPLEIVLRREGSEIEWRFGPACDCRWTYLTVPHYDDFAVGDHGRLRTPRPLDEQWFRVMKESSDGSWTVSPSLRMPADGEKIEWKRDATKMDPRNSVQN
ncbi:MAG TPA: hypothetical protein VM534_10915 [Thermoanaerobaculia bacterium]|nr:hypothetical protein [Thermoanaerobaculia bacterium]